MGNFTVIYTFLLYSDIMENLRHYCAKTNSLDIDWTNFVKIIYVYSFSKSILTAATRNRRGQRCKYLRGGIYMSLAITVITSILPPVIILIGLMYFVVTDKYILKRHKTIMLAALGLLTTLLLGDILDFYLANYYSFPTLRLLNSTYGYLAYPTLTVLFYHFVSKKKISAFVDHVLGRRHCLFCFSVYGRRHLYASLPHHQSSDRKLHLRQPARSSLGRRIVSDDARRHKKLCKELHLHQERRGKRS